jgi:hypothetical protein
VKVVEMGSSNIGPRVTRPLVTSTIIATQHAYDLAEQAQDEELRDHIQHVYELVCILDQQMQALEQENLDLRRRLASLRPIDEPGRKTLASRRGVFGYWFLQNETAPLCPVCCERDDAVSYLTQLERVSEGSRRTCPTCESVFWEQRTSELPVIPGSTMCHVCGCLMLRLGRWFRCRGCGSARGIG